MKILEGPELFHDLRRSPGAANRQHGLTPPAADIFRWGRHRAEIGGKESAGKPRVDRYLVVEEL